MLEWLPAIGTAISAGLNFFGGKQKQASEEATRQQQMQMFREQQAFQEKQFQAQQAQNLRNEAQQREFAQSGIRWRVQDAIAAGLHPLAALGGSGASFSPAGVTVGGVSAPSLSASTGMAQGLSAMGQDIGRALQATRTQDERELAFAQTMREMSLQRATLQNDLLASQIARLKVMSNPPGPRGNAAAPVVDPVSGEVTLREDDKPKVTPIFIGGKKWAQDRGLSDANDFEQRYGETLSDWVFGPYIAWRDYNANYNMENRFRDWTEQKLMVGRHHLQEYANRSNRRRVGQPLGGR